MQLCASDVAMDMCSAMPLLSGYQCLLQIGCTGWGMRVARIGRVCSQNSYCAIPLLDCRWQLAWRAAAAAARGAPMRAHTAAPMPRRCGGRQRRQRRGAAAWAAAWQRGRQRVAAEPGVGAAAADTAAGAVGDRRQDRGALAAEAQSLVLVAQQRALPQGVPPAPLASTGLPL